MPVLGPNDYEAVVDLIADAFNTQSSNISSMLASYGADNAYDAFKLLENTPYNMLYSYDGSVNAYSYTATVSKVANDAASNINSNLETLIRTDANLPISTTYADPSSPLSGPLYEVGPRTAPAASAGSTVMAVLDKVALGVMGVSIGAKLGAFIDSALYNAAPDFWDSVCPTINPETWGSIATTDGGKWFINTLFGIDGDKTTPYVPTDVLAYYALLMQQQNFFNSTGGMASDLETVFAQPIRVYTGSLLIHWTRTGGMYDGYYGTTEIIPTSSDVNYALGSEGTRLSLFHTEPMTTVTTVYKPNGSVQTSETKSFRARPTYTYDGRTVHIPSTDLYNNVLSSWWNYDNVIIEDMLLINSYPGPSQEPAGPDAWTMVYGHYEGGDLPAGVTHQPDAILPSLSNDDSIADVDRKLREQYPDWYRNPIYLPTQQPDGSIKDTPFIPLPFVPNPNMDDNPTNNPDNDDYVDQNSDPAVDPETSPDSLIETIFRYLNPNPPDTVPPDPDTGDGTSPAVVIPSGSASSLWSVYNPTQAQVNAFGAWLWSSDFIDQIAKLFLQPMDAIVGIHKVFAPPIISGSSTIVCGYLDSEVPSAVVGNQYTYVDCGTVKLSEYFGNVFDYSPYTSVRLYLPFIGIIPLDVADVMRASINVRYGVDVITGACLAMVRITRDGDSGGILYQYGGSCVVHYPHSSGSYMGIVGGIVGLAASALSMIGGGPLGMAVDGLRMANHAMNSHASYQVGGSFSGEPGAMGGKKPYLIISRPQPKVAASVESFMGYPANYTATLTGVRGFVRILSCHVSTIKNATDIERAEIERHLKDGVVIA